MNEGNYIGRFTQIETDNLVLRRISVEDAPVLYKYWSDQEVTKHLVLEPFKNLTEVIDMINLLNGLLEKNEGIRWGITKKEDNKVVGTCGFHNIKTEHLRAEMGYELGKEYWGQGIMAEALLAIISYGFNEMKFNRIESFVNSGNDKSVAILEKIGFQLDGMLREYEFARGKFIDQYCYSLLKKECGFLKAG